MCVCVGGGGGCDLMSSLKYKYFLNSGGGVGREGGVRYTSSKQLQKLVIFDKICPLLKVQYLCAWQNNVYLQ